MKTNSLSQKEQKEIRSYSFAKVIKTLAAGKTPDGLEGEMHQEGIKEYRSLNKSAYGFVIPSIVLDQEASHEQSSRAAFSDYNLLYENPFMFNASLKNALALTKLGANFIPGLFGNLNLFQGKTFTGVWLDENTGFTIDPATPDKITLSPKVYRMTGGVSNKMMLQSDRVVELFIRDEIVKSMASGIEQAALSGGGGIVPTGILNTAGVGAVVGGTNGIIPTWANILDLENKVLAGNGASVAYITNPSVLMKLKQTVKSGVSEYIINGSTMNGGLVHCTKNIPSNLSKGSSNGICSAIVAGDFTQLFIGMWGGVDIIIDPVTRADYSETKMTLGGLIDVGVANPTAFAAMKDALTT